MAKLYSIAQVAGVLGISRIAAWKLVKKRNLTGIKVGRAYVVTEKSLQAYLKRIGRVA